MTAFRYSAADSLGRDEVGVLEADSARQARQMLRSQGLVPLAVEPVEAESSRQGPAALRGRRLSQTELAVLTRQFASLLAAALPIADALTVLVEQSEQQAVREMMASIRTEVRGGMSLSAALSRHPRQFPAIYRALIAAGEESGKLGSVLGSLADFIEERARLQQKIALAFVYPAILTVVALLVVVFLLTYVIPQVVQVFAQTKQALPLLTRAMIGLSAFLRSYGWVLIVGGVAAAFAISRALRVEAIRLQWHRRILRLPIMGTLSRAINTARFASTLSILVGSGVPMLRALQAAGETVTNLALRARVVDAAQRVREGASLARALRAEDDDRSATARLRLFPPVLIHLISSGEATGKLPEMLARAADMHAREAERRALLLTSLLEPALILSMGLVVMLIVLAVLMPIIEINQLAR
ncbi:MAG TPA: type II secretion system inner membrane protein GspF [Burkholderiaceae bacterium]|nr:type II secretion system inner membrane protein GspF [Burkholderiaceae bacterium]